MVDYRTAQHHSMLSCSIHAGNAYAGNPNKHKAAAQRIHDHRLPTSKDRPANFPLQSSEWNVLYEYTHSSPASESARETLNLAKPGHKTEKCEDMREYEQICEVMKLHVPKEVKVGLPPRPCDPLWCICASACNHQSPLSAVSTACFRV